MFGTISAAVTRGGRFARRRRGAVAAIALWLWSSWVIAAGCCCEPAELAAASVALHPHSASSADEHDHGHGHPLPLVPGGLDGTHSQDSVPVDDCTEIQAPAHGIVPKEAVPAGLLTLDHVALAPALPADLPDFWGDPHDDWSLPPPPIRSGDPFLDTVRLLL